MNTDLDALDRMLELDRADEDAQEGQELRRMAAEQRRALREWLTWANDLPVRGDDGRPGTTIHELQVESEGGRLFDAFVQANSDLQEALEHKRGALRSQSASQLARTVRYVAGATALALALAAFVSWRTIRGLVRPLQDLRDTVRRQRQGERNAWADTDRGVSEVRDLAADVNELSRAQHRLVDDQALSIALLRAANGIVRQIQDASSTSEALNIAVTEVSGVLAVERVVGALFHTDGTLWDVERVLPPETPAEEFSPEAYRAMSVLAADLWDGDGRMVVDDVVATRMRPPRWAQGLRLLDETRSLLVVPIGQGSQAVGGISLHVAQGPRHWSETEIAFVQRVAREVARHAAAHPDR